MPAVTKKRPPMEAEPGEGKLHEKGESPEEETREGAEPVDAPRRGSKTNRKRSAKNANSTKAPMDGDCGCGGKKGASCDGNCGSYAKKMDALTPQEYLTACELGIQGRSRSYIRARLDTAMNLTPSTLRADLKCGNGSISEGEKCTKGTAQKVRASSTSRVRKPKVSTGQRIVRGVTSGLAFYSGLSNAERAGRLLSQGNIEGALMAGGSAVGSLSATHSYSQGKYLQGLGREAAGLAGGVGAAAGYGAVRGFQRAGGSQKVKNYAQTNWGKPMSNAWKKAKYRAGSVNVTATRVTEGPSLLRGRRDSVYASGFTPDLAQLSI